MNPSDILNAVKYSPSPTISAIEAATRLRDTNHVQWFQERIEKQIKDFQEALGPNEAILATVVLPDGRQIIATWFGYHGPDMLVVHGLDEQQQRCRVLSAFRNVHVLLTAVSPESQKVRTPIGFQARETAQTEK